MIVFSASAATGYTYHVRREKLYVCTLYDVLEFL